MQFLGRLGGEERKWGKGKKQQKMKKDVEVRIYGGGAKYDGTVSAIHKLDPVRTIETPTQPKSF